ncbi:MAG: site-specific integrase, partial [Thermus sp.]|nr:site-specific integrase [Thermus sp.]
MKRRGKGGGTTYYDPRGDRWVAELKWVDELTGKVVRIKRYAPTRKEAEALLGELKAQKAHGLLSPSRLTVRDFAVDYLRRKEKEGARPNTVRLLLHELAYALPSLKD